LSRVTKEMMTEITVCHVKENTNAVRY